MTMKAISIRQPWAWLIVRPDIVDLQERATAANAGILKTIENRSRRTWYRGPLLIHASQGMTREEYESADDPLSAFGGPAIALPAFHELQRGGIVGVTNLEDCITSDHRESWWHIEGQMGLRLSNTRPLPFVACKGALGIFNVPPEIVQRLQPFLTEDAPITGLQQGALDS